MQHLIASPLAAILDPPALVTSLVSLVPLLVHASNPQNQPDLLSNYPAICTFLQKKDNGRDVVDPKKLEQTAL